MWHPASPSSPWLCWCRQVALLLKWGMGVVLCRRSILILPAECKYRVLKAGLSVIGGLSSTCVVRAGSQGTQLAAGGALGCAAVVAS
jgi:hypothetical protein